jgi:lipopolysaccharide/colanic/teichoic acid biosynthesis glycosyltransferase
VLYVDDNPATTKAFCQAFNNLTTIYPVSSRQDALLKLVSFKHIDGIVINERMSVTDFQVSLRTLPRRYRVPIIVLTETSVDAATTSPYGNNVLDRLPYRHLDSAVRSRLEYLIQKKQYDQTCPDQHPPVLVRVPLSKRLLDIFGAVFMLISLIPMLCIVAVLIRLDSPGPVFYRARRIGMGYRQFNMFKFRTMRPGADTMINSMVSQSMYAKVLAQDKDELCEQCFLANHVCQQPLYNDNAVQVCEQLHRRRQQSEASFMKFVNDPRVTKIGRFLRNSSIDELPQLINILKGDMSFVGNRPLPPYEAEKLTTDGSARRFAAPAGLTGLWQITKRGQVTLSEEERIQLDVQYARSFSLGTDLRILLKTLLAVWQKENV